MVLTNLFLFQKYACFKFKTILELVSLSSITFIVALSLLFNTRAPQTENYFHSSSLAEAAKKVPRAAKNFSVTVWNPQSTKCHGNFQWYSAASPGKPAVLVREAAIDARHALKNQYARQTQTSGAFLRVVVFASVVLDNDEFAVSFPTTPVMKVQNPSTTQKPKASIRVRNSTDWAVEDSFDVQIDNVITDSECTKGRADRCYPIEDPSSGADRMFLRPGVTKHCFHPRCILCAGPEWQILLSISSSGKNGGVDELKEELWRLEQSKNAEIFVEFPVNTRGGTIETFQTRMGIACVSGLTRTTSLPPLPHLPQREHSDCQDTSTSVMLLGNSLFGRKRDSKTGRSELAHFAIRSLLGHIRFDTVVLPVLTNHTVSQVQYHCGNDRRCHSQFAHSAQKLLNDVASDLNEELDQANVPVHLWSRIIVMPFCRLGSDHKEFERHYPCLRTYRMGQFALGNLVYTLFSPKHAWTVSMDADEMLVDESRGHGGRNKASLQATTYLNGLQKQTGENHLWLRWFDFRSKPSDRASISRRITNGLPIPTTRSSLTSPKDNRGSCYSAFHRNVGKSAVSCTTGMGYAVHVGVLFKSNDRLSPLACTKVPSNSSSTVFVYHARGNAPRFGNCVYNESA